MKKSKIKLQYSLIVLLTITFIIKLNIPINSKYNKNETKIKGIITECQNKTDKTVITIKGKEKILINYYNNYPCKLGVKITAQGKIKKPSNNTAFNLFNYKEYLLSKNIKYTFTAEKIENTQNKVKLKYKIKNRIIKHIKRYKSKEYISAFILGNESLINKDIKESYQANGVIHLFAISGAQILLLASISFKTLNYIFENKKASYIGTIIILVLYLFITNSPPSILRATIFLIVNTIKKEFKLDISPHTLIILIALILLNINPNYIYSLGFKLSFIISFYLTRFNKVLSKQGYYLAKTFTISYIAFITSAPLIINTFFHINLLSPIINILFVPLITFIIYPLSIIAFIFKPLDKYMFILIKIMEKLSTKIQEIALFDITIQKLSLPLVIIYYIIITIVLYSYQKKHKNSFIIPIILLLIYKNINIVNITTKVTAIDVGQGDSILIKLKNNKGNILIDTGGDIRNPNNKIAKSTTIPYLKSEGINRLDYIIFSHGDLDHIGEAINLVKNFKVDKVIFNCGPYNNLEKELIKVLDKKSIKYYSCIKELNIDKNKLYFLQTKEYDNENDNSNVIYTELNGYKFMFMGDASNTTEKEILDKYYLTDIDVLKAGHHGSKTSSSKEFIDVINPKYSIISVGKNNWYGHPNKKALDNLKYSKIYRTDQDGSIMFKIRKNKLKIETCSP